jgi:ketosteroid isomerase-like protein
LIVAEHDSEATRDRKLMEQEVIRAGRDYNELMKRLKSGRSYAELVKGGEIAALDRLLADEYMYTEWDGRIYTKTQDLESYKTNRVKLESAEFLVQKARVIGAKAAIETGTIRYKGSKEGKPFDITKRYTTTWTWRDGRWRIAADHTSRVKQ